MSNQKKILSLQGLRAVMFFLIFFFHSDLYLDRYFELMGPGPGNKE